MLLRLIRRLKNRAVKQKRQPQEVIETDLNWIWQPFENSSTLQFSATVKKVAAAIIESSADDIPTITLELDPRLVIPLCAIQLQDEINLTQLSSLKNKIESLYLLDFNLAAKIEFFDRVLSEITPNQRWLYLFKSLTPELQFALLSRLINYRRPTRNDWRNLFEKIEYEFKKSREYLIVLTVVFLLSLGSIIEIFAIMLSQLESWVNGLMAITIAIVLSFLIVLWREFQAEEDKSEPTLLMQLGLLGPWTFCREWYRLLRKNLVWEGITALYEAVVGPWAVAGVVAWNGGWALALAVAVLLTVAVASAVAGVVAWAVAWAVAVLLTVAAVGTVAWAGAAAGTVAGTVAAVWTVAWAGAAARSGTVDVAGAVAVAVAVAGAAAIGYGLGIWYRAKTEKDLGWVRFLSILAFPWFCWFPIVFGFTSFALYHRLSWEWQSISLFWLVIFGFCTVLWVRGKKLEEKARNPLRGILDGQ